MSIREQRNMLDRHDISTKELTECYLERIERFDPELQSYITVTKEKAMQDAEKAQKKIDAGTAAPLCGIPLAIKDNICTEGIRTTCASKMLEDFIPPYNATVMEKLEAQDVVMLGKTSMDEFAMGGSTQTSAFAKTKNPFDKDCVPGGSSGGSAACVSASLATAALGSDTGGSIRQPSAFCGVTGLKPTYGRVSRYGLVAFASSLDQIGPIAKSPYDCALILNAIAGYDPHDGTVSKKSVEDYTAKIGKNIEGLKIALPEEFFGEGIDDNIRDAVMEAAKTYEKMGATLVSCNMPSLKYAVAAYYLIASAEASSNLSRYDGIKYGHRSKNGENFNELICNSRSEGFGDEVKRRILLGNYALSSGYYDAYYGKALALRQKISAEYASIFANCDVMLTPTTPTVAYHIHENISDPVKMYQADICTVRANIAALPSISTPCGYDKNGMPIGMSLTGRQFDESTILQVADAFSQQFTLKSPSLSF